MLQSSRTTTEKYPYTSTAYIICIFTVKKKEIDVKWPSNRYSINPVDETPYYHPKSVLGFLKA